MHDLSSLDMELLKKIDEQPGLTIREVIDPFLESRSRRALYYKILTLAAHGFVRLDRTTMSRKVLCYPTAETRKMLGATVEHLDAVESEAL
jgi:hypothetical protein